MAIGDIQLTFAALDPDSGGDYGRGREGPSVNPTRQDDENPRGRVIVGEQATDTKIAEELRDTALPRSQVEVFLNEIRNQPHWRREADRAVDYYDSNQLSPETIDRLRERGQPPLISNVIKPTIDTVLGMEAKTRTDWRVRPEDNDECPDEIAEALTVKLKHAEIESRADRAVSDAYSAEVKAGLGWVEVGREHDPFRPKYRVQYVHRREIFWDWRAERPDLSDARYLVRRRWLELDNAIAIMPQYAKLFRMTTGSWAGFDPLMEQDSNLVQSWEIERDTKLASTDWRDTERQRICMYEIWYRKWVRGFVLELPNGTSIEADFNNPRHNEAIVSGFAKVKQATFQKIRLAWYTGPHFLYDIPSPYRHKNFPYVPFFGYREDLTGVPYGLIRSMISPQDEINARKSKMLWSLNSRRVVTDSDAVKDHVKTAQEVSRPDAYIILDANRKPNSQFRVDPGGELATQQFAVMQEAKQEIAQVSGIHKAMMGQESTASSGLAINSLVEQGLNTLAEINDNYRFARRLVGEMLFDLVREDLEKRPTKVTIGEGAAKRTIMLNMPTVDPVTGATAIVNDTRGIKSKIVLDDVPSTPTYRMQQLQMLSEITKSLPPQMQSFVMDFVIEATDMPRRHEIADRIRAAVGIKDPKEAQAMAAAQQQAQQQEAEMARQEREVRMQAEMAKAQKLLAEAERIANEPMQQVDIGAQLQPLREQIIRLQGELASREREIEAKYNADIAKANIDASAKVQAEQAKSASMDALRPLADQIQALVSQIQQMNIEHKASIDQLNTMHKAELQVLKSEIETVRKAAEEKPEPKAKEEKQDPAMAQVLATLAQAQATLAKVMSAPRQTKIVEDKNGRAIGAVSKPTDEE